MPQVSVTFTNCTLIDDVLQGPSYLSREKIYIREAYRELVKVVKDAICVIECKQQYASVGIRVTGTPGVGRSCFLPYVKEELLKDKRKVFVTVKGKCVYFHGNEVEQGADPSMLNNDPSEEYIIHLFDPSSGSEVAPTRAITILFISPERTKYGDFRTENIISLFMLP